VARRVDSHQCWPPIVKHRITKLHDQIKKLKK